MTTRGSEAAVQEAVSSSGPLADSRGRLAQRATSLAILSSEPQEGSAEGSSESDAPSPFAAAASLLAGYAGSLAGTASERVEALSKTRPLHTAPPAIAVTWQRHREAASQWEAALARWLRHGWGVIHVAVTGVTYGVVLVTATPAGFVVTAALILSLWFWL